MSGRPVANPNLRVSDAERTEVADALKRHCTEGRLDQAEFEVRIDRALRAKTRIDLAGLLDDLPPLDSAPTSNYRLDSRPFTRNRSLVWTLAVVAIVIVASLSIVATVSSILRPHIPWVLVIIVAAVIWHRGHHHHHHHHQGPWRA